MSTKTSFKRIALVAVAALGLGVLSVAPSSAGEEQANIAILTADTTGSVGTPVTATVRHNYVAVGDKKGIAGAAFYATPLTSSLITSTALNWTQNTDTTTHVNVLEASHYDAYNIPTNTYTYDLLSEAVTNNTRVNTTAILSFTPDKAGTYLVRIFGFPRGTKDAIFVDWTVVVTAPAPTAAASTGYESGTDSTTQGDFALATDNVGYAANSSTAGSLAGVVNVFQKNGSTTNPLLVGGKLTVTVSGAGLVTLVDLGAACSATGAVRALTGTSFALSQKICMYSDGSSGVGTFAWSTGTTKLGSTTATFYGAPASYTATINNSVIQVGAHVSSSLTGMSNGNRRSVQVVVKDANGVAVPGALVYMNSSDKTVISGTYQSALSDSLGRARFDLTGVAAGTSNLTFTNRANAFATTPTTEITAGPLAVRVGSTDADKVTLAFDKSSYLPGEKATITVTATDSKGNAVPRGIYSLFNSALSSSLPLTIGSTPGTAKAAASCADAYGVPTADAVAGSCAAGSTQSSPALAAGAVWISGSTGTATFSVNMPSISGSVTVSGTVSTYLNAGFSANAGTAISATATVEVNAGTQLAIDTAQAATDAAAEATDAANAATDAANAAAEAADAATAAAQDAADAVAALSAQVATMIAGLKAQLTALTNLIIKIQKKVKA
jgi:protocatechuate 3,4-dioxygenase beta subunit